MAKDDLRADVQVGAHGRLVIPAPLRRALNLMPGEQLVARQVGEGLLLERRATVERRLQERFRCVPAGVSLVEELIRERRTEAAQEDVKA